jgi:hypothetical protein
MCFNFTGQTKDNIKARRDLVELCNHLHLELRQNPSGYESRPRAPYYLMLKELKEIFQWLKNLKFLDHYAANIKRVVNLDTGKLVGLKSHDYHILIERLVSVMFCGYFSPDLWKMLAELSYFYRQICAKEISKKLMRRFEKKIIVLVCKMEKVFPPRFMNCMQYLLVHLPWEVLVGGPVQFRWMYSQERELKKLRVMVRNKARVEGCIAEAFAVREITLFSSKYFSDANNVNAQTTRYHITEETPMTDLSAFQWDGKGVGSYTSHLMGMKERNKTLLFLYINMPKLDSYFKIFDSIYKADQQLTQKKLDDLRLKGLHDGPSFVQWFHEHVISSMSIFV